MSDKLDNEIDEILGDLFVATHGGNTASDLGTSNVDSVDYSKAKAKLLQMFTAGATSPMQSSFQDLGEGKGNKVNTDQLTEARIDELEQIQALDCLLYTSPSPRDRQK